MGSNSISSFLNMHITCLSEEVSGRQNVPKFLDEMRVAASYKECLIIKPIFQNIPVFLVTPPLNYVLSSQMQFCAPVLVLLILAGACHGAPLDLGYGE